MNSLHWIYTSYRDEEENCAKQGKFVTLGLAGISSSETLPEGRCGATGGPPSGTNARLSTRTWKHGTGFCSGYGWPKAVSSLPSPPISDPYN